MFSSLINRSQDKAGKESKQLVDTGPPEEAEDFRDFFPLDGPDDEVPEHVPVIDWLTLDQLEQGEIASFNVLPARERRKLLLAAGVQLATSQKRTKNGVTAERKARKAASKMDRRTKQKIEYKQKVQELGIVAAAALIKPTVMTKQERKEKVQRLQKAANYDIYFI
jgi:hypothetical protein